MLRYFRLCLLCLLLLVFSGNVKSQTIPDPLDYILNMVHHNPGEPLFITKYIEPEYLHEIGYNGDCPRLYIQTAITYNDFETGIIPYDSDTWAWIQRYAKNIDQFIRQHKQENMPIYPFTDVLVVPKEIMDKYGSQMKDSSGRLSIQRTMTQNVLRAQIAEIFKRFPDIDGLMIRFGETYLSDTPFHVGTSPLRSMTDHNLLINILREEICVKRDKKVFYRTWDFGTVHTNPTNYLAVTDPIEPHPNLIFSIKHTNADFLRDVPLNTTLGIGKHKQIVEVSLMQAGIYGKGAYPYYIGNGVLHGWSEMSNRTGISDLVGNGKLCGIYIWPRGDGWSGPYLSNEFWVDINGYIMREFGKRPGSNDQELFEEYCQTKLGLDTANTAMLYELCLLSAEAVFDGKHSRLYNVNQWLNRDDKIRDVGSLPSSSSVDYQLILDEKEQAVADWRRIETLSTQIVLNDPADQEYLEVSSTYGRIYFEILQQLWILKVYDATNMADVNPQAVRDVIVRYDELWQEWYKLEQNHPSCATLYMTAWPQTWPPTWRESRTENFTYHHDTPLVQEYRNLRILYSELENPSFEDNGLSDSGDFDPVSPNSWTGNAVGTVGVIGEDRTSVTDTPYGTSWLHLQGTGAAAGQPLGDISLIGQELKIEYIVSRRTNEGTSTDHLVKIIAGTSNGYSNGIKLGEVLYDTSFSGTGTYNDVSKTITPSGDPGSNDTIWLVFENNLSGDSQLHIDGVCYISPGNWACESYPKYDLNEDCIIDVGDMVVFSASWMESGRYPDQ